MSFLFVLSFLFSFLVSTTSSFISAQSTTSTPSSKQEPSATGPVIIGSIFGGIGLVGVAAILIYAHAKKPRFSTTSSFDAGETETHHVKKGKKEGCCCSSSFCSCHDDCCCGCCGPSWSAPPSPVATTGTPPVRLDHHHHHHHHSSARPLEVIKRIRRRPLPREADDVSYRRHRRPCEREHAAGASSSRPSAVELYMEELEVEDADFSEDGKEEEVVVVAVEHRYFTLPVRGADDDDDDDDESSTATTTKSSAIVMPAQRPFGGANLKDEGDDKAKHYSAIFDEMEL
jgi:hypothetical protein